MTRITYRTRQSGHRSWTPKQALTRSDLPSRHTRLSDPLPTARGPSLRSPVVTPCRPVYRVLPSGATSPPPHWSLVSWRGTLSLSSLFSPRRSPRGWGPSPVSWVRHGVESVLYGSFLLFPDHFPRRPHPHPTPCSTPSLVPSKKPILTQLWHDKLFI